MIATLFMLALGAPATEFEVQARETSWDTLTDEVFDRRWILPEPSSEDPEVRSLLGRMRQLAVAEYMDRGEPRCFGDLVAEARGVEARERESWLSELEARAPRLMNRWGNELRQLLLDDYLRSDGWKPGEDHPRDGILMGSGWEPRPLSGSVWSASRKDVLFEQGAALYFADLTTVKAVENDYRTYPSNVGAEYEAIFPLEGKHLSGTDPAGNPFRYLQIFFESDLPFPFSTYESNLNILNRLDDDGVLRTDIYSTSEDFYYMAGQDAFLPVTTSDGEPVGYLAVRDFGFDLRGVPDGRDNRREALRSTLGNMKRNSEARFDRGEDAFSPAARVLSGVRVYGRK